MLSERRRAEERTDVLGDLGVGERAVDSLCDGVADDTAERADRDGERRSDTDEERGSRELDERDEEGEGSGEAVTADGVAAMRAYISSVNLE